MMMRGRPSEPFRPRSGSEEASKETGFSLRPELGRLVGRATPAVVMGWRPHAWAWMPVPACHAAMSRPGAGERAKASFPSSMMYPVPHNPLPLGATRDIRPTVSTLSRRRVQVRAGLLLPQVAKSGKPTDTSGQDGASLCIVSSSLSSSLDLQPPTLTLTTPKILQIVLDTFHWPTRHCQNGSSPAV